MYKVRALHQYGTSYVAQHLRDMRGTVHVRFALDLRDMRDPRVHQANPKNMIVSSLATY
jgi:hypothetical protein